MSKNKLNEKWGELAKLLQDTSFSNEEKERLKKFIDSQVKFNKERPSNKIKINDIQIKF